MPKKTLFILISLLLISPALVPVFSIFTADETRVCGIDNKNYPNLANAKKLDVDISYEFPCEFPESEEGLFERREHFEFAAMLLDFFADLDSAQLLVKDNFDNQNYFITSSNLEIIDVNKYLPGDQLKIKGVINKNTKTVIINNISNLSVEANKQETINCQIVPIEHSSNTMGCVSDGKKLNLSYDKNTRFVAGFINPASASDFEIADLVRVRIDKNKKINTILLKERGNLTFLKNHVFETKAKFLSRDLDFINVELVDYPNSIGGLNFDKNNLNIKLKISEDTRIVKKYFGKLTLKNFKEGDDLYIVGQVSDRGNFEAITIKNNSVWK